MNRTALVALSLLAGCVRAPAVDVTDKQQETGDTDEEETGIPEDVDRDGYTVAEGDCDDADASTFPGAFEVCDGVDQDCNGQIDDGLTATYYRDADGDGYGALGTPTEACGPTRAYVADATDCRDSALDVHPGAAEFCDGVDDDCDGVVDDGVTSRWFADLDGDGYGDPDAGTDACEQPAAHVTDATDCDDDAANAHPDRAETCDELDNNCDGAVDEGVTSPWYADADGDGHGDPSVRLDACVGPEGYSASADDCDDEDGAVGPGGVEVCDGVDQDCDGAVDEDAADTLPWYADADEDGYGDASSVTLACDAPTGSVSDATDCDDADPDRGGSARCRPDAGCTHPSPAVLEAADPSATSDLTFDATCGAWVASLVSGPDSVQGIDAGGAHTILLGESTHNIGSLALDPVDGTVVVSYNDVGFLGVQSGSDLRVVATGGFATGSSWGNEYLDQSASSIVMDVDGCIWVPNWSGVGTLDCLTTDGVPTTLATFDAYVESVALAPDEADVVYASVGPDIHRIDVATGETTVAWTFADTVLDMVFDFQGDLYVETTGDEVRLLEAEAATDTLFTPVTGSGKLAITPDGYLVRVETNPIAASTYAEWALGD